MCIVTLTHKSPTVAGQEKHLQTEPNPSNSNEADALPDALNIPAGSRLELMEAAFGLSGPRSFGRDIPSFAGEYSLPG